MRKLVALVLIEQITKAYFASRDFFVGPIHFHLVKNFGLPFGISMPNQLVMIIVGTLALILILLRKKLFTGDRSLAFVFLMAGAVSNLLDRILFGLVRDFIDIGIVTINLADLFIVIGLAMFIFSGSKKTYSDELSN